MGSKQYRFSHNADAMKVADRLLRDLQSQAADKGMTLTRVSDREFRLKRTGAELTFTIGTSELVVVGDLAWVAEPFRAKLEAGLNLGMPKMLRECERA
jgi:hypothetical protein